VATSIALALVVSGLVWLAVRWWRAGGGPPVHWLDHGDQLASMTSTVLTAAGVVLAYLVWRRPNGGRRSVAEPASPQRAGGDRESGEGQVAGGPPRQLPREAVWFTGRTAELERLLSMGPDPGRATAVVISAIDGMAGVGKTALAVYAAHRMVERFPDGQLFIDLHGFTATVAPVRPAEALDRLLRMLGVPGEQIPAGVDDRAALWRSVLAGRRMLIVLDNAATEAQVAPLLPGAAGCLVLVTSRRRLAGLEATHTVSLDTLPVADAVAMFASTAGQLRLVGESRELVVEAVELCGRLPLAIRIAAARLTDRPVWALADLVARLRDEDLRLAALADPERMRSVTAALELSYQQLDAGSQRMYRLLGLHPGPDLDLYAAAALADIPGERSRVLLDRLISAHLLQEPAHGRYKFHDLVRAHAITVAEAEPGRRAALALLLDHYQHTAAAAMDVGYPYERQRRPQVPPARTPGPDLSAPASALGWLDVELPNLLAAARYATEHGRAEYILDLSAILHRHLWIRGRFRDAERLYHRALTTARATGHRAGQRTALVALGDVQLLQGRYESAADHFRQGLRIARSTGDRAGEATPLVGLGRAHRHQGDYEQAADRFGQGLRIARTTGNHTSELDALVGLADIHGVMGRYEQAASHYGAALQIACATGNRAGEVHALVGLGRVDLWQGRYEQAADHFGQVLRISRSTGNRGGELNALNGLGHAYRRAGRHAEAIDHYRQALLIARATRHRISELNALNGLAWLDRHQGRHRQAVDHYQNLLDIAQDSGDRYYEFEAWQGLGRLQHAAGQPETAVAHHAQALTLADDLGRPDGQARAHDGLAHAHHTLHHNEQARRHWQRGLEILVALGADDAEEEQVTVAAIRAHLRGLDPQSPNNLTGGGA
jgi:tetratricopeptide (TPR) repeat protein